MPATLRYLDSDLVTVYENDANGKKKRLATLLWGDNVRVIGKSGNFWKLDFTTRKFNEEKNRYEWIKHDAFISGKTRFRDKPLLKVRFVDVGQGDAAIVESPKQQTVLIDGGEQDHIYNYMTASWAHVLRTKPLELAAIVVTHGDADHFAGLTRLVNGFGPKGKPPITCGRIFHNGLVKRPDGTKNILGKTVKKGGVTYITDVYNDLLSVPDKEMNGPFLDWKAALKKLRKEHTPFSVKRLEYGDDAAFDFLRSEGIDMQVLGPMVERISGNNTALRMLKKPGSSSLSTSHTINGHSIVLRMTYGNVRFLFGADLNDESQQMLVARARQDGLTLSAEVLKVPHHGSEDFSGEMLDAVRPVVSVVSSGDESGAKEYIHPRAGLVGALGKYSRGTVARPLIYVTEMVAFFKRHGFVQMQKYSKDRKLTGKPFDVRNAYEKTVFGIVHIRTDGTRVLVATHSGREDKKEAYAFTVDANGGVVFEDRVVML